MTVLVVHDGAHLVDTLHELGLALELAIGMVVLERPDGHVVLELPLVEQFTVRVLLPRPLFLAVFVGDIRLPLREKQNRQEKD